MERISLVAPDAVSLVGHRFAAQGSCRGVVVIPSAMGVKQDYYFPFARYLSEQGYAALTFDYRGMGHSAPRRLRGYAATLHDWAHKDYDCALRHAKDWQPAVPLFVIGHSLGAQLPGMVPSRHLIDGIVTVAAGSGYWRENAPQVRRVVWFLWYVAVPLYTAIAGYFPGKRLRKIGDLPKGVVHQWSRWCRDPEYLVGVEGATVRQGFQDLRCPLLSVSFTDDELMSARGTESLHGFYENAPKEMRRIAPKDIGAARIGHFGFFREHFRDSLWRDVAGWLHGRSAAA